MKGLLKRPISNVLLLTLTVVVVGFVLELAIRSFFTQPLNYFYFKKQELPGDRFERWDGIEVQINSFGHRDYEYPLKKKSGDYRIAVIGDSVAYGTGVALENTYHKQLQNLLNNSCRGNLDFEVLSFSAGGDDLSGYLEMIRDDASRFKPDMYIVGFCLNDFVQPNRIITTRERYYNFLREIHARMRITSHLYYLIFERTRALLYKQRILDKSARRSLELQVLEAESDRFWASWRRSKELLLEIKEEAAKQGSSLILVLFPYEMQLNPKLVALYRQEYGLRISDSVLDAKPQGLVVEFARSNGIAAVDLLKSFRKEAETELLYFRELGGLLDWVHPNERGYGLAAKALLKALVYREALRTERGFSLFEGCEPSRTIKDSEVGWE